MKKFFAQDKVSVGIIAGVGAEVGFCLALAVGLLIAGEPLMAHVRWFAGMFIPLILVLHHYAKKRTQLRVTKTLIVVFFVTFLAFMFYLLKSNILVLQ
ncbi:MAG: hypothetical protein K6F72_01530 [Bacteroidales bacterium]|nr:hypothetical protein [Bacteroidales bacterium]